MLDIVFGIPIELMRERIRLFSNVYLTQVVTVVEFQLTQRMKAQGLRNLVNGAEFPPEKPFRNQSTFQNIQGYGLLLMSLEPTLYVGASQVHVD